MEKNCPKSLNLIKIVGFVVVFKKVIRLFITFYKLVLRRKKNLKERYGNGSWAFITGSSEGTSKIIARNWESFCLIICKIRIQHYFMCKDLIKALISSEIDTIEIPFNQSLISASGF